METDKKYWLHRITGGDNAFPFAHPLLFGHGYLSIGWTDFSEDSFVRNTKEKGIEFINEQMQAKWGELRRNRYSLLRFIKEMKKGDYVVVPTWEKFSVFEIADDIVPSNESIDMNICKDWNGNIAIRKEDGYIYNADQIIDLGFYRKVTPVELDIPREGFADAYLYSRMKILQTNADITDLADSVDDAIKRHRGNNPVNLKNEFIEKAANDLLNKIRDVVNEKKFEELVRWYLEAVGAKVDNTSTEKTSTEEGDADCVGFFENIKTAIMVQVKKHDGKTGNWAVQQIARFEKNHNYDDYFTQKWVISSADDFSEEAKEEAMSENVRLINGLDFCTMILDAGLESLPL